ncbi:unnamed protein product [Gordionus sp. m RMFG-2023]
MIIKANLWIFIVTAIVYPNSCFTPNSTEIEEILDVHNRHRANVQPPSNAMFKLRWNQEAAVKAEIMANKCIFQHDTANDRIITNYPQGGGQNLFWSNAPNPFNWTYVIKAWHDEVSLFKFGQDSDNFLSVGHYTQLVWGTTKEIGCARSSTCRGQRIYTCNYYPPGNYLPYYVPYRKAVNQTCDGCLINATCAQSGPFKNKLLESCDLFCVDKYSNCQDLAARNYCSYFMKNECALSCRNECKL